MLKFIICDDNLSIMEKLSAMLNSLFIKHNFNAQVVLQADNTKEVLDFLSTNEVNVVILDINLKSEISGIELAQIIRKTNKNIYIIFTTGHLEYAMLAYKVKTFDYLAKPITLERLEDTILRLFDDMFSPPRKYLKLNSQTLITLDDILFIKKDSMKLIFFTSNSTYTTYNSFSKIESSLSNNFVRCHKSYIVNVCNILSINLNTIYFKNNLICYIGPKYKNNFMEVLNKYGNLSTNMACSNHA